MGTNLGELLMRLTNEIKTNMLLQTIAVGSLFCPVRVLPNGPFIAK